MSTALVFVVSGTDFKSDTSDFDLEINGALQTTTKTRSPANTLTTGVVNLVDGENVVVLRAFDSLNNPLFLSITIWAGPNTLVVTVRSQDGSLFTPTAQVTAAIADDLSVTATGTTSSSIFQFNNIPTRTILITATASGNVVGTAGVVGGTPTVTVTVNGLSAPSLVANNDFATADLSGWEIGDSNATILDHDENVGPTTTRRAARQTNFDMIVKTCDDDLYGDLDCEPNDGGSGCVPPSGPCDPNSELPCLPLPSRSRSRRQNDEYEGDYYFNDEYNSECEGESLVSRTILSSAAALRVRYRFITSEVPGGFFGSQYNDYYRVTIRSARGLILSDTNTMNDLGLAAFDFATGSTAWMELVLPLDCVEDVVQVDIVAANVNDGAYQSAVVVDFIEEIPQSVATPCLVIPSNSPTMSPTASPNNPV